MYKQSVLKMSDDIHSWRKKLQVDKVQPMRQECRILEEVTHVVETKRLNNTVFESKLKWEKACLTKLNLMDQWNLLEQNEKSLHKLLKKYNSFIEDNFIKCQRQMKKLKLAQHQIVKKIKGIEIRKNQLGKLNTFLSDLTLEFNRHAIYERYLQRVKELASLRSIDEVLQKFDTLSEAQRQIATFQREIFLKYFQGSEDCEIILDKQSTDICYLTQVLRKNQLKYKKLLDNRGEWEVTLEAIYYRLSTCFREIFATQTSIKTLYELTQIRRNLLVRRGRVPSPKNQQEKLLIIKHAMKIFELLNRTIIELENAAHPEDESLIGLGGGVRYLENEPRVTDIEKLFKRLVNKIKLQTLAQEKNKIISPIDQLGPRYGSELNVAQRAFTKILHSAKENIAVKALSPAEKLTGIKDYDKKYNQALQEILKQKALELQTKTTLCRTKDDQKSETTLHEDSELTPTTPEEVKITRLFPSDPNYKSTSNLTKSTDYMTEFGHFLNAMVASDDETDRGQEADYSRFTSSKDILLLEKQFEKLERAYIFDIEKQKKITLIKRSSHQPTVGVGYLPFITRKNIKTK